MRFTSLLLCSLLVYLSVADFVLIPDTFNTLVDPNNTGGKATSVTSPPVLEQFASQFGRAQLKTPGNPDFTLVGGERDVEITTTFGPPGRETVNIKNTDSSGVFLGQFAIDAAEGAHAGLTYQLDGIDNSMDLNPAGISPPLNFKEGGAIGYYIDFSSDKAFVLSIEFYSGSLANNYKFVLDTSQPPYNYPTVGGNEILRDDIVIPFGAFTANGSPSWNSITAIQYVYDTLSLGTENEDVDPVFFVMGTINLEIAGLVLIECVNDEIPLCGANLFLFQGENQLDQTTTGPASCIGEYRFNILDTGSYTVCADVGSERELSPGQTQITPNDNLWCQTVEVEDVLVSIAGIDFRFEQITEEIIPIDTSASCAQLEGGTIPTSISGEATFNSECGDTATITFEDSSDFSLCDGVILRSWYFNGNLEGTQEIDILDEDAPVPAVLPLPISVTPTAIECDDTFNLFDPDYPPTSITGSLSPDDFDDCTDVTVTYSDSEFSKITKSVSPLSCGITFTRTWTARDECGNEENAITQTILIRDTQAPILEVPDDSDVDIPCEDRNDPFSFQTPTVIEICDPEAADEITFVDLLVTGEGEATDDLDLAAYTCGSLQRKFTVADRCGLTDSLTLRAQFTDTTKPSITFFDDDDAEINFSCVDPNINTPPLGGAGLLTYSDQCTPDSVLSLTITENPTVANRNTKQCIYTFTRQWSVDDACGNTESITQTITVTDDTAPALQAPLTGDLGDIECFNPAFSGPTSLSGVSFKDTCGPQTTPTIEGTEDDVVTNGLSAGTECSITWKRTYTVDDGCENVAEIAVQYTVVDTTEPSLANIPTANPSPIECSASINPSSELLKPDVSETFGTIPIFQDTCSNPDDLDIDIVNGNWIGTDPCRRTFKKTYTATDRCNLQTQFVQTITVQDTTPVVLNLIAEDVQTTYDEECINGASSIPARFDNPTELFEVIEVCQDIDVGDVTFQDNTFGSQPCNYGVVRRYFVVDPCASDPEFKITFNFKDTTPPEIQLEQGTVTLDCQDYLDNPNIGGATASDACGKATLRPVVVDLDLPAEFTSDLCSAGGQELKRTFTADDECGKTTVATQFVYLISDQGPRLTVDPVLSFECNTLISENDQYTPDEINNRATPELDCFTNDQAVLTWSDSAYTGDLCIRSKQRTWTVTDPCGRTSQAVQEIRIEDNAEPEFTFFPDNIKISCDSSTHPSRTGIPLVRDLCEDLVCNLTWSDFITQLPNDNPNCAATELISRTWRAEDSCGNFLENVQEILIDLLTSPQFCPPMQAPALPCELCECPQQLFTDVCNCCANGGVTQCNPVPCNPVPCTPVPCTTVDCLPCEFNTDNTLSPPPFCTNDVPCIPNIVPIFVDDDDNVNNPVPPSLFDRIDYWRGRADYWRSVIIQDGTNVANSLHPTMALAFILPIYFVIFLM